MALRTHSLRASVLLCALGTAPLLANVYVSNVDSDTVSVINTATNTVICTLAVGNEPRNLAANPAGTRLYVPNRFSNSVTVIDATTATIITTVTHVSFDEPYAAAVTSSGTEVWVVNKEGGGSTTGSVTIIDTATNTVSAVIDNPCFSSPEGIAMNPVLARAYVINRGNNTVCVVDTGTRAILASPAVGGDPRYAVATLDGSAVYVSGGPIHKINTATNVATPLAASGGTPRNMALSNAGDKVYVAQQNATVEIINTATDAISTLTLAGATRTYGVAVVPGTNLAYVSDETNDNVLVFNTATDTQITGAGIPITVGNTPRAIAAVAPQVTICGFVATATPTVTPTPTTTPTSTPTTTVVPGGPIVEVPTLSPGMLLLLAAAIAGAALFVMRRNS